ncbi:MAG: TldD/PmbA family protein [Bdellovibrionaceae bacterium]|nr:TldD/PmbA family protein [Pseudobdellovibrionaceae bacterium]
MTHFNFEKSLSSFKKQVDWVGIRYYRELTKGLFVRNENVERNTSNIDQGVMIEVMVEGHFGYAATSDLTSDGLKEAFTKAKTLSTQSTRFSAHEFNLDQRPNSKGKFQSPHEQALSTLGIAELVQILLNASEALKISEKIVSRIASATMTETSIYYLTSSGAETEQNFSMVSTLFQATAKDDKDIQTRSFGNSFQKGAEVLRDASILNRCRAIANEAVELLSAENCPTEIMDVLIAPDQMLLQIHESIGHPLELDRILGDERNFAGWSFVKPANFGSLQYGSSLLNVIFDPTEEHQLASYAFDDVGNPATKEFLIQDGVLVRGLGSLESQTRLGVSGVANARAASWNRAPVDRMANINILPGQSSLEQMISSVKRGLLLKTNKSWSIDDYRNKFQFSCEYGQMIENGKITRTVKNPNYRGKTLEFWNNLKAVGEASLYENHGTPTCGKGEPSQIIRVAHGSPYCLFGSVEVFGGLS